VESVFGLPKHRYAERQLLEFALASLEVIRRGHWNFYRYFLSSSMENENEILSDINY
jgi:hypothetical protein